jgi:hypothetical protein
VRHEEVGVSTGGLACAPRSGAAAGALPAGSGQIEFMLVRAVAHAEREHALPNQVIRPYGAQSRWRTSTGLIASIAFTTSLAVVSSTLV